MDSKYLENYNREYSRLNSEQKQAVDTIDGPVMVIAGAGTGKTQTIALRIGKILTETQVNPNNILCLTFTESAALNMRQRLISLIGPTAYSVRICTFHAFCNSVIKDHPEFFLFSNRESSSLDDVKLIQIIRVLIDDLPSSSPLKSFTAPYFYQRDIISSIQNLKKENITPSRFEELIKFASDFVTLSQETNNQLVQIRAVNQKADQICEIINKLSNNSNLNSLYQSRLKLFISLFDQGTISLSELKKNIRDFIDQTQNNLPKLIDLLVIYQGYQQSLLRQHLFDYDDMILWVVTAFQQTPSLLSEYQETYQYILVDEFQDTNSSQTEIINLLSLNQSSPNLFVVGDDDQSIFRFQGASIENIYAFLQKYQDRLTIVVLKNNYRSHRLILELSDNVIKNNLIRITQHLKDIDKSLVATCLYDPDPINLTISNSSTEEITSVAQKVKTLLNSGVKATEIAVLYRHNTDILEFLPVFNRHQIKYLLSDSVDILKSLEIQQLITLLKFIANPQDNVILGQILSYNFLSINSFDLYRLFHYVSHHQLSLSEFIADPKKISKIKPALNPQTIIKLKNFNLRLAKTIKDSANLPLDQLFNLIIRRFGYLGYLLKHRRLYLLKQLNLLYNLIKTRLQNESIYNLSQFVNELNLLLENQISLNSQPLLIDLEQSIRLMTVHKAKGLEFEHVFLIKVISGKWDDASSRNLIKLPLGIIKTDITQVVGNKDIEEDRRLFYVALTRAKKQIYLSYSKLNDTGREQLPSQFVNEINPTLIQKVQSSIESESQNLLSFYSPNLPRLKSINLSGYIQNYLSTSYRFNITHLNSYLKCPLCFFFKTILRLPFPKTKSLSLGTSVHGALAYLYEIYKKNNRLISLDKFLQIFNQNLKREHLSVADYSQTQAKGIQILTDYYLHYQNAFNKNCLTEHDFRFFGTRLDNIPITGKIDRIDFIDTQHVNVIDYKTGKPDYKYQQLSPEGDYFRQLVFYKILCENTHGFPYKVTKGTIDFVEKTKDNQYKKAVFDITSSDTAILTALIKDTFARINQLDFSPSPTCKDPDHLHYLSNKYFS